MRTVQKVWYNKFVKHKKQGTVNDRERERHRDAADEYYNRSSFFNITSITFTIKSTALTVERERCVEARVKIAREVAAIRE